MLTASAPSRARPTAVLEDVAAELKRSTKEAQSLGPVRVLIQPLKLSSRKSQRIASYNSTPLPSPGPPARAVGQDARAEPIFWPVEPGDRASRAALSCRVADVRNCR